MADGKRNDSTAVPEKLPIQEKVVGEKEVSNAGMRVQGKGYGRGAGSQLPSKNTTAWGRKPERSNGSYARGEGRETCKVIGYERSILRNCQTWVRELERTRDHTQAENLKGGKRKTKSWTMGGGKGKDL